MPPPLTVMSVFVTVTLGALIGMTLGGAFGFGAGSIAPDMFSKIIPWDTYEPVGTATVLGAAGGVFCGAALAVFGILMQLIAALLIRRCSAASDARS
jgi:hypothetical protein